MRGQSYLAQLLVTAGVSPETPQGKMIADVIYAEQQLLNQRTRDALAERRAAGITLGRPRVMSEDIRRRIIAERSAGRSTPAIIAAGLDADGVPTAHGGQKWHPSAVYKVLKGEDMTNKMPKVECLICKAKVRQIDKHISQKHPKEKR